MYEPTTQVSIEDRRAVQATLMRRATEAHAWLAEVSKGGADVEVDTAHATLRKLLTAVVLCNGAFVDMTTGTTVVRAVGDPPSGSRYGHILPTLSGALEWPEDIEDVQDKLPVHWVSSDTVTWEFIDDLALA